MRDFFSVCAIGVSTFLLASSPQIDASIYKWKDNNGQIHYSQIAPYGVEKEVIQLAITPNKVIKKASTKQKIPESSSNNQTLSYCQQQQEILQALRNNPYVKWKAGDKEVLLEGDTKAKQIEKIQTDIQKFCSNSNRTEKKYQTDS